MHVPGKLCGMCAAIPRYLRDVRNAGWAGQVFKDYEEFEAWLAQHDAGVGEKGESERERRVPGPYVESESEHNGDDGNTPSSGPGNGNGNDHGDGDGDGHGNDGPRNGGRDDAPPKADSSSSSLDSDDPDPRPKSSILPDYLVPPRLPRAERRRMYGGRITTQKKPSEGLSLFDRLYAESINGSQEPPSGPKPGSGPSSLRTAQIQSGRRAPRPRSQLEIDLKNSDEHGWGFRYSPPSSPESSQSTSPPAKGYVRCPTCTLYSLASSASCEACGTPWPLAPVPRSQARGVVAHDQRPDTLFGSSLIDYKSGPRRWISPKYKGSNDEDDEPLPEGPDRYICTGAAGSAGTLDDNGEPVAILYEERTRLLNARETLRDADSLREARERERRPTANVCQKASLTSTGSVKDALQRQRTS
jgi:hypothetical protein